MYVSIYNGFVCVQVCTISSVGRYGADISINPREWHTFINMSGSTTTKIGRFSVKRQKAGVKLIRSEDTSKTVTNKRQLTFTTSHIATMKSHEEEMATNIKPA